jgi:gas vesicle protein GvpN
MDTAQACKEIQNKFKIIGRDNELNLLLLAIKAGKHILIEGEVGVGKTTIAKAIAEYTCANFYRVDGTEDTFSHTLVGYYDPPVVIAKGYTEESFIYGPLSKAMMEGGMLFINELNRMPESTQNILLTALDENLLAIPKLKSIKGDPKFRIIATQNPQAHVGTTAVGEALKDRFVWLHLDYQPEPEEIEITLQKLTEENPDNNKIAQIAVKIVRETRRSDKLRRGSSIRGAIDMAQMLQYMKDITPSEWVKVGKMALITKVEVQDAVDESVETIIEKIIMDVLGNFR